MVEVDRDQPNPEMKNTYNPNTFDQQKSKDEQNRRESAHPAQGGASTTGSQPAAPSTESNTSEQVEKQTYAHGCSARARGEALGAIVESARYPGL